METSNYLQNDLFIHTLQSTEPYASIAISTPSFIVTQRNQSNENSNQKRYLSTDSETAPVKQCNVMNIFWGIQIKSIWTRLHLENRQWPNNVLCPENS